MRKEIEIEYQGVPLTAVVEITGKYLPATQIDPEEFPETELIKVYVGDTDIIGIFYDSQLEEIYNLCLDGKETDF